MDLNVLLDLTNEYTSIHKILINENDSTVIITNAVAEKQSSTFFNYVKKIREHVYERDLKVFDSYFVLEKIVAGILNKSELKFHINLKNDDGNYKLYQFEVVYPQNTERDYTALFTWKKVWDSFNTKEEVFRLLTEVYYKVLDCNLSEDTYTIIRNFDRYTHPKHTSEWAKVFANKGNVYFEDTLSFIEFTSKENLQSLFNSASDKNVDFKYRRKTPNGCFRWTSIIIKPALDFTLENQHAMLYVKDIHDNYTNSKELEENRTNYYQYTHTSLGVKNQTEFDKLIYKLSPMSNAFGVHYIRVSEIVHNKSGLSEYAVLSLFVDYIESNLSKEHLYQISPNELVIIEVNELDFNYQVSVIEETVANLNERFHEKLLEFAWRWDTGKNTSINEVIAMISDKLDEN